MRLLTTKWFQHATFALGALLSGVVTSTQACDRHATAGFGRFPVMHAQYPAPNIEELVAPISLKHAKKVLTSQGKDASIPIYYRIPKGYQDVEFKFNGSPEISFQDEAGFSPEHKAGIYRLKYHALEPGRHSVTILIKGKKSNKPYSKVQTIEVVAG
ncbi:hypothetical protein [Planctobacterium marinum]|uniref:hypothetical protein n=1 Tax=Planctobacterium marinum TaxID=1631968 RepID=UPI001E4CBB82|nr:hypothetical protein [Planctobacterium marinum]MCC2603753.1 hypothetical protein [Planctobacterium marinum]